MENVIILNGETYVKVSKGSPDCFTEIYYVNRRRKGNSDYLKGIPFLNYDDAVVFMDSLINELDLDCYISSCLVYTRL